MTTGAASVRVEAAAHVVLAVGAMSVYEPNANPGPAVTFTVPPMAPVRMVPAVIVPETVPREKSKAGW